MESLPNELLLCILRQISSPSDLRSVILASKPFNSVFKQNKSHVLTNFLRHAIPSTILPDAYAACKAPKISAILKHDCECDCDPRPATLEIESFISEYQEWKYDHSLLSLDLPTLTSMCRLWTITNQFILRYVRDGLETMEKYLFSLHFKTDSKATAFSEKISRTEEERLQRAFFRFEVLRKLYGAIADKSLWRGDFLIEEQAVSFFDLFELWEVEEIRSVYGFLKTLTERIFDETIDNFVNTAKDLQARIPMSSQGSSQYFTAEQLEFEGLEILQEDYKGTDLERHIDFEVGRGLPFLQKLSCLSSSSQFGLLGSTTIYEQAPALIDVLEIYQGDFDGSNDPMTEEWMFVFRNTEFKPSEGWLWRHAQFPTLDCPGFGRAISSGLIFWDHERLSAMGLSPERLVDLESCPDLTYQLNSQSGEERLSGVKVPCEFVEELIPEEWSESEVNELIDKAEY